MNVAKQTTSAIEESKRTSEQQETTSGNGAVSRRNFLGVGSAGLATGASASLVGNAQERADIAKGEQDHSASNPGPENKPLGSLRETARALRPVCYTETKSLLKREIPSFCMRK